MKWLTSAVLGLRVWLGKINWHYKANPEAPAKNQHNEDWIMAKTNYPSYEPSYGYMTEKIRHAYIAKAIDKKILPSTAYRMQDIVSLSAPSNSSKPIQFWQLYSVLGQKRIVRIVQNFYRRVYQDKDWFRMVFARVGDESHHVRTQSAMWLDAMGGGLKYHGAEFRLNFHHQHNAFQLMNEKGAERWIKLMVETLDTSQKYMRHDPRVRISINTFLEYFMDKYASDFGFKTKSAFGPINAPVKRTLNFMNMTDAEIETLSAFELKEGLADRGVDEKKQLQKRELVKLAKRL